MKTPSDTIIIVNKECIRDVIDEILDKRIIDWRREDNALNITFNNGSHLRVREGSHNALRGCTANKVIIYKDGFTPFELAKLHGIARCIIISSPRGEVFEKLWKEKVKKK